MTLLRRVLAVVLWVAFVVLAGIGGWLVWHTGLALYVVYILLLWFASGVVLDVLHETLWD